MVLGTTNFPTWGETERTDNLEKPRIARGFQAQSSRRPKSMIVSVIFAYKLGQEVFPEFALGISSKDDTNITPEIHADVGAEEKEIFA